MENSNNAFNLENGGNGRRNKIQENQLQVACSQWDRRLCNNRGVINHLQFCNPASMDDEVGRPPPSTAVNEVNNNINGADDAIAEQQFFWGNTLRNQAIEELKQCYEEIVFWRKNLFMLPKRSSSKDYIKEIARMINEWLIGSPISECAMYALHVMPALLLQKPSKCSERKDHVAALKRRLKKWKFLQLLREAGALQSLLPKIGTLKTINVVSRKFCEYMSKGNANLAIILLLNNMEGGELPLNTEVITLLEVKHLVGKAASDDTKLHGPLPTV